MIHMCASNRLFTRTKVTQLAARPELSHQCGRVRGPLLELVMIACFDVC